MPTPTWTRDDWFEWLVDLPLKVTLTLVLAVIARWLTHRLIDRVVRRAGKGAVPQVLAASKAASKLRERSLHAHERRELRAQTVGSLLKSVMTAVIGAIAVVMVLALFGLPITPLLTSAGIAGVAFGFGAQSLVKDFLSGIFMMLEDQYGVGDIVDLGEASGTVEAVGLRVTKVRDVGGTAWYVRNGEILRVGNHNQEWGRAIMDVTVPFDADFDQVHAILQEEAHAMYTDSSMSQVILEEPQVWGVDRFDKDGAVVRTVLKTAPLHQWAVARALRSRVLRRFDEAGIRIPSTTFPPSGGTT